VGASLQQAKQLRLIVGAEDQQGGNPLTLMLTQARLLPF
jgi:hypothetical protein